MEAPSADASLMAGAGVVGAAPVSILLKLSPRKVLVAPGLWEGLLLPPQKMVPASVACEAGGPTVGDGFLEGRFFVLLWDFDLPVLNTGGRSIPRVCSLQANASWTLC